jgi:beta-glucosidase
LLAALLALGCDAPPSTPPDAGDAGPADGGRVYVPEPFTPTEATRAYCPLEDEEVEARITALLAALSPREKIALMQGDGLVGGVWLASANTRLGVPGLRMLDGPRGLSAFSGKNGTAFPVGAMRGATFSPSLEREVGAAMGRELRSAGADVLLAPTINILRHPRWGRAQETYGEDVHHLGELAVAFIEGVQSEGVLASVKHFAANSIEDTRHEVNVTIDERALREIYLPHFRRAVQDGRAGSVMSAYNRVNGAYCDLSGELLTEILREDWQFAGFVESDWLWGTHGSVESVRAGLDLEMPMGDRFRALARELAAGAIEEAELDRAVRRLLRAQLCYGLDRRERVTDEPAARETEAHLALALEVARRGIVLLENRAPGGAPADAAPVLPLERAAIESLVVLGRAADVENIGDEGSSRVAPSEVVTALEGLRARAGAGIEVTHIAGPLGDTERAAIASADAVVVVTGLLAEDEGEGDIGAGDRDSLALPEAEVALVREVSALSERVVVVLEGGSAITVSEWVDEVEALLFAFYPGQQGGLAIADVLFGDVAPAGRLPFSVPVREADLPPFDSVSTEVTYDFWHGYRHLQREDVAPQYPFGYGLGYTQFSYSNLSLSSSSIGPDDELVLTFDVTNVGDVTAIETAQVYVHALDSRVERAPRDLRAFTQVALGPGETREVVLTLSASDLAFWDVDAHAFEVERTRYALEVGASSADVRLAAPFSIE